MKLTKRLASVTLLLLVTGGCAGPSYSRSESTAQAARAAATETGTTQSSLDGAMAALKDLLATKEGDLKAKFDQFSKDFDKLSESLRASQRKSDDLAARVKSHLDAWEKDLAEIKNEDLKASSRQHKVAVETGMDKAKVSASAAKAKSDPFLVDLGEVRKVLGTDLTQGGLAAVRNAAAKVEVNARSVREAYVQFNADLDALQKELSTGTATADTSTK